jgi:protein-tyrosine phosphatase
VYLGRGAAAQDQKWLQAHGITHILNVADDVPNFYPGQYIYCNLQVGDFGQDAGISRVFTQALTFVQKALTTSHMHSKVLVHCANGSNRSATVLVALLMQIQQWSLRQAWLAILTDRPNVYPLKDNQLQLLAFEIQQRKIATMTVGSFAKLKKQHVKLGRKKDILLPVVETVKI